MPNTAKAKPTYCQMVSNSLCTPASPFSCHFQKSWFLSFVPVIIFRFWPRTRDPWTRAILVVKIWKIKTTFNISLKSSNDAFPYRCHTFKILYALRTKLMASRTTILINFVQFKNLNRLFGRLDLYIYICWVGYRIFFKWKLGI